MDYKVTDTELISIANTIRTKGGTSAALMWPDEWKSAINAISGGSNYPPIDAIFAQTITGYPLQAKHNLSWFFDPASPAIQQAVQSYFTTKLSNNSGTRATSSSYTIDITQSIAEMSVTDFEALWYRDAAAMEYARLIYNGSIIQTLGLVLLGDFSQGGATAGNTLLDSIANYSGVILQGVFQKTPSSNYNTSVLYQNIALDTKYWAGMKDRNNSYTCYVTFTDNNTVSLGGNKQVVIYGIS